MVRMIISDKSRSSSRLSVYIPPSSSPKTVICDFNRLLQEFVTHTLNTCIILGDFNLSLSHHQQIEHIGKQCGLHQLVHEPTHELGSVLDLVFTNHPEDACKLTNTPICYSDHHALTVLLKLIT